MVTHSRTLAWRILWMAEPGGLQSMESQRVGHDCVTKFHFRLTMANQSTNHIKEVLKGENWTSRQIQVGIFENFFFPSSVSFTMYRMQSWLHFMQLINLVGQTLICLPSDRLPYLVSGLECTRLRACGLAPRSSVKRKIKVGRVNEMPANLDREETISSNGSLF